jgi:hypothetical protein
LRSKLLAANCLCRMRIRLSTVIDNDK